MPINEYWTHDQALAWVVWRDPASVRRVGPCGDVGYRQLRGMRARYGAPADTSPLTLEIGRSDDDALEALFRGPHRIGGKPDDLAGACADGIVKADGCFEGGRMETIPAAEWKSGRLSSRWKDVTFSAIELRKAFPAWPDLSSCGSGARHKAVAEADELLLSKPADKPESLSAAEWMKANITKKIKKRDAIIDCRNATGCTWRAAEAAYKALSADKKRSRGAQSSK
jgi:hypothetical protein